MRSRAVRLAVVLLLVAVGATAGIQGWRATRAAATQVAERQQIDAEVDAIQRIVLDLGPALAGYVAPGMDAAAPLQRFPGLIRDITGGTARLSRLARSDSGRQALRTVADSTSALAQADAEIRDTLLLGDTITASYSIAAAQDLVTSIAGAIRIFRTAETAERDAAQAAAVRTAGLFAGGSAIVWLAGLIALAWSIRQRTVPEPQETLAPAAPGVDVGAVAGLCTDLARVSSTAALSSLLDRAVILLDGVGAVVWTSGGEELYAVASCGYDPESAMPRRPIRRDEDHATARAWRECELQVVTGADGSGGIAAPMRGPEGCSGVFAVETRNGRENDPVTCACVELIAAQLSNIIGTGAPAVRATGT